jgi:two-component system alkaline phosphatase synthesis response regulator PhoP
MAEHDDRFRLLIVDDEPEIGELLSYNFRKKGFHVVTATNGEAGMQVLRSYDPDLIILDIMMPYSDGITMCRKLRNDIRFKSTPILFLTATSNDSLIKDALDAGGDKCLSKPIQINLLIEEVIRYQMMGH